MDVIHKFQVDTVLRLKMITDNFESVTFAIVHKRGRYKGTIVTVNGIQYDSLNQWICRVSYGQLILVCECLYYNIRNDTWDNVDLLTFDALVNLRDDVKSVGCCMAELSGLLQSAMADKAEQLFDDFDVNIL